MLSLVGELDNLVVVDTGQVVGGAMAVTVTVAVPRGGEQTSDCVGIELCEYPLGRSGPQWSRDGYHGGIVDVAK